MSENWQIHWKDYYKILQIDPSAETEVIKGAYDRLVRKYHPDINKEQTSAKRTTEINEAYETLGTPEKKRRYDIAYREKIKIKAEPANKPSSPYHPQQSRPKPEVRPNVINFHDLKARETRKETFIIKNSGGSFSKILISEPPPWIKIIRKTPISANDKLPLSVEIEASGDNWGKTYTDKIVIKLDDIETHVRVELNTRQKPKTMGMRQWFLGISLLVIFVAIGLIWRSNISSNDQEHTANPTNTPAASSTAASASNPADRVRSWTTPPAMQISTSKKYTATVNTTLGNFKIQLLPQDSPKTVNNFVFLSRQGFYDGVIFHRIMKTFMIQTGDPLGTGMGDPGYKFADELPAKYPYDEGIVAMANSGPNTNGSQFFICTGADSRNLNRMPNYTQFGKIIEGMDTVQKIAGVPVSTSASGESSKPVNAPVITSITITEQ